MKNMARSAPSVIPAELPLQLANKIVVLDTGCWGWTAACFRDGYASITWKGKRRGAHRIVYQLLVGPIPEGLVLDHVRARGCMGKPCVNPAHLEPVTVRENVLRGVGTPAQRAQQTHCHRGHEFTEENTYRLRGGPTRACRACAREAQRRYRQRRRGRT